MCSVETCRSKGRVESCTEWSLMVGVVCQRSQSSFVKKCQEFRDRPSIFNWAHDKVRGNLQPPWRPRWLAIFVHIISSKLLEGFAEGWSVTLNKTKPVGIHEAENQKLGIFDNPVLIPRWGCMLAFYMHRSRVFVYRMTPRDLSSSIHIYLFANRTAKIGQAPAKPCNFWKKNHVKNTCSRGSQISCGLL